MDFNKDRDKAYDPFKPVKISPEQDDYIRKILKISSSDSLFADKAYRAIRGALIGEPVIDPFGVA